MRYAPIDVRFALAAKALSYRFILVKLLTMSQTLELQLFEAFLDLAEGQLNCVVLRRVRDVEDVLNLQHLKLTHDEISLMGSEVIHHDHYLILLVDCVKIIKERRE